MKQAGNKSFQVGNFVLKFDQARFYVMPAGLSIMDALADASREQCRNNFLREKE